jgi:hypothetical protein
MHFIVISFWGRQPLATNRPLYDILILSVCPVGGLWTHRSTILNNLDVIGKLQYSSFRKIKFGRYPSPLTPPSLGSNGES